MFAKSFIRFRVDFYATRGSSRVETSSARRSSTTASIAAGSGSQGRDLRKLDDKSWGKAIEIRVAQNEWMLGLLDKIPHLTMDDFLGYTP